LTIDPHKLGYVPYSSGAFLAATRRDYFQKSFGAPYVNFNARQDKGPFTLEGSRSAAGAVATWMTAKCVGLSQDGYGSLIARTILLKKEFEGNLEKSISNLRIAPAADANLLGFCIALKGESLAQTNLRMLKLFEALNKSGKETFFVSKTKLYQSNYANYIQSFVGSWQGQVDAEELVLIRLCIMNPFFKTKEMKLDYQELFVKTLEDILPTF
jgi:glutamate/tyrosine decarboxylase-like PLP-dependent enzyme